MFRANSNKCGSANVFILSVVKSYYDDGVRVCELFNLLRTIVMLTCIYFSRQYLPSIYLLYTAFSIIMLHNKYVVCHIR